MNLELEFCTNFNGVYIGTVDDEEVTSEMEKVFDEVSDTLPEKTYDMCKHLSPFDDIELTQAQVDELIADAQEIIKDVVPNANIVFRYNCNDT